MSNANEFDRIERYLGHDALQQLANKTVALVGLGSGGGFVAVTLAMSGVGHFILIDDDKIEATNLVRHVADRRYLNQPKVHAVADLIRQRAPHAEVEAIVGRIADHTDKLDGVDLVISGVDGERAKYEINDVCRARGLTAVYAGVYERGEGGDVVVIRPNDRGDVHTDEPCYACWAGQLREGITEAPNATELDYGMIGADGTIAAEPGLWLHVVRIAAAHADLALNELLIGQAVHRTYPANTVILANVDMEIFDGVKVPPYSAEWLDVKRDPKCLVCGIQNMSKALSLDDLAEGLMVDIDQDAEQHEQGHQ